ncbi:MAG: hypothetical protein AB7O32_06975 [Vicinamibacterales bacterium]
MPNRVTSRRPGLTPADVVALDDLVPGGLHSSWLEFLLQANVGVPERTWQHSGDLVVSHFLGVSPLAAEDFAATLARHKGGLAPRHVPIGRTHQGHLLCMDAAGRIHAWDPDRHDRRRADPALVEPPVRLADSLQAFLADLSHPPHPPDLDPTEAVPIVTGEAFDALVREHRIDDEE